MPLGREQFLVGRTSLLVREAPGVEGVDGCVRSVCCAQDPPALPAGSGGEPPGQRGRIADLIQLARQAEPDVLADVFRRRRG